MLTSKRPNFRIRYSTYWVGYIRLPNAMSCQRYNAVLFAAAVHLCEPIHFATPLNLNFALKMHAKLVPKTVSLTVSIGIQRVAFYTELPTDWELLWRCDAPSVAMSSSAYTRTSTWNGSFVLTGLVSEFRTEKKQRKYKYARPLWWQVTYCRHKVPLSGHCLTLPGKGWISDR